MFIQISRERALREIKRYHPTFDKEGSYTDQQIAVMMKPTMLGRYGIAIEGASITEKFGDKINYFIPT